jgi:hypothetical protein
MKQISWYYWSCFPNCAPKSCATTQP